MPQPLAQSVCLWSFDEGKRIVLSSRISSYCHVCHTDGVEVIIHKLLRCTGTAGWLKTTGWWGGWTKVAPRLRPRVSSPVLPGLPRHVPSTNSETWFQFVNIRLTEEMVPVSHSLIFICMTGNYATQKHKPLGVYVETLNTSYSFIRETIQMT